MKWFKDIFLVLAKKVTAKQAFILLIICSGGFIIYKLADRYFEHQETMLRNSLDAPRHVLEKDTSYKEMNIKYADITDFDTDRKTGMKAK